MKSTYSHPPHSADARGRFEQGNYQQQLQPQTEYRIDSTEHIDTEVRAPYFACAMIRVGSDVDHPPHQDIGSDDFLVINIKDVPVQKLAIGDESMNYKKFMGRHVPGTPDFLLLNREFRSGSGGITGWMPLYEDEAVTVGRAENSNQHFHNSDRMSRRHFRLACRDGELTVTDLDSSNGTTVTTAQPLEHAPVTNDADPKVAEMIAFLGDKSPLSPHTVGGIVLDIAGQFDPANPDPQARRRIRRQYHPDKNPKEPAKRAHAKSVLANKLTES